MRGLMGSFAVLPLEDLVELLARRRRSGTLSCERGTVRKTLHVRDGVAIGASSNDPREFLGQLLINFGHLTEEQLGKAFQTQEETKVRLGKVLTMVGLVSPETIREVLAIKIRETVLDAFLWDSGLFSFDDSPPAHVDELDATVPLEDIAREAEFRATAWNAFRAMFPSGAAPLEVDEKRVPRTLADDSVNGRLLALAREGKTIDEVGLALHATDFHLYQRLYALGTQGLLRAAPVRAIPPGDAMESAAAGELVDRARVLLATGRAADAELVAGRAVGLAPGSDSARAVLEEAERALSVVLRRELLDGDVVPRLTVMPHDVAMMRLSSVDKYLLSRCDGRRSIRELAMIAPLRELEVLKAMSRFVEAEIVVVE